MCPTGAGGKGEKTNRTLISLSHGARAPRGDSTETQVLPSTKTQTHTFSQTQKKDYWGFLTIVFKVLSLFAYHTLILSEKLAQEFFFFFWIASQYAFSVLMMEDLNIYLVQHEKGCPWGNVDAIFTHPKAGRIPNTDQTAIFNSKGCSKSVAERIHHLLLFTFN